MARTRLNALQQLARKEGIQTSFIDVSGVERFASEASLRRLLGLFGKSVETDEEARETLSQGNAAAAEVLPRVIVLWEGNGLARELRKLSARRWSGRLQIEGGDVKKVGSGLRGKLPDRLPLGYHQLHVETPDGEAETLVLSAPRRFYSEGLNQRNWGAFAPLYANHSEGSWGAGNFSDWQELSRWVGGLGGGVVSSLPLLAGFLEKPFCDPSPYSPASRFFWNEFFIDVEGIPEYRRSKRAQRVVRSSRGQSRLAEFRRSEMIDYQAQMELRRRVLEILAEEFFSGNGGRRNEFNQFARRRPEARDYAEFRAATELAGKSWHSWANRAKGGILRSADYDENARDYHLYVQWIAQEQMDRVLGTCRASGVKFYLDLPLGVNPESYDSWRFREFFAQGASAGAPPDSFFTKGQDWGFAPLHPKRMRELHYKYVIEYLRFQMRHTGMLRIDHVMGLHRLYWVPHGLPASEGAYVRYPAEELYAIYSIESHRHKTILAGENLGTVPPEVNRSLKRHGMRTMYVLQYEQPESGPVPEPANGCVASLNTHDMPTFAAHWDGKDIADRVQLGLLSRKEASEERRRREKMKKNLVDFLHRSKLLENKETGKREVLAAVLKYLMKSKAGTVLINLEDLWLESRPQNVPGTSTERPNWRRKLARPLEQIQADRRLRDLLRSVAEARGGK